MLKTVLVLMSMSLVFVLGGCAYTNPQVSKAISEEKQYEEMRKQTAILERNTKSSERAAAALERLATATEKK